MVDFDRLNEISHTTSMLEVLEYYGIDYYSTGPDRCRAVCPFHNDHSPSLVVYTSPDHRDESFCCYVDNTAGDVFQFIREMEGDFRQAWLVLCEIRGIKDGYADKLAPLVKPKRVYDTRSVESINRQFSFTYRDLYKRLQENMSESNKAKLTDLIDRRYKAFDEYLTTNPPYADVHQYYKIELTRLKKLYQHFKNR